MIVLVCGGRDYEDAPFIDHALDWLHANRGPVTQIVHGMARGADSLAGDWALRNKVRQRGFIADWQKHGKAAGPIRNMRMLEESKPDLVVAFPGNSGTANMVKISRKAGAPIWQPSIDWGGRWIELKKVSGAGC